MPVVEVWYRNDRNYERKTSNIYCKRSLLNLLRWLVEGRSTQYSTVYRILKSVPFSIWKSHARTKMLLSIHSISSHGIHVNSQNSHERMLH